MKSKNSRKIIVHILLLLGITITVFPFVWMILTSFKTVGEAMQIPPTIFPKKFLTGAVLLYGSLCICKNRIPV